ncbi:hypothetical protein FGB62_325g013 [Gracilaria domingensis]|nr:hypothetical protein FGB62_325g013 [Gracilaria domingensis]
MRNAYATGDVGAAVREALESFLLLLRNTSLKNGSPTHAAAALRYLCQGGHPVVPLERTADAMSYIHGQMIRATSGSQKELDDAESEALGGIFDVVSNAAEAHTSLAVLEHIREIGGRMLASEGLDLRTKCFTVSWNVIGILNRKNIGKISIGLR